MFLLPSLAIGLVFAVILGGDPRRLAHVSFRSAWLSVAALGIQVVLFSRLGAHVPHEAARALHLGSYALLLAFGVRNLRMHAFLPAAAGLALNALAIAANNGIMPLSRNAAATLDLHPGVHANVSTAADHLTMLGDVFVLPSEFPFANVFSVGDLLIGIGVIAFVVLTSLDLEEAPVSFGRLMAPFREHDFRRLAAGKLLSHAGDWLTLAALIGWIYSTTGSTGQAAVVLLIRLVPPVFGGGVAAIVVDRIPKAQLLPAIELGRGLAVAGALAGVVAGSRAAVFGALIVSGALAAISQACVSSLVPALLPAEQLPAANAGVGIAKDVAMALGAAGAGVTLAFAGPVLALSLDLATFAAAFFLFAGIRATVTRPSKRDEDAMSRESGGVRYLLSRRTLVLLVASFAAATLATGMTNATLPRFLGDELGLGAGAYGFGIAALAVGLALGQAAVGVSRVTEGGGRWMGAALVSMAGLFLTLALVDHGPTALLLLAAIGFVDGTTDVLFETAVQRRADSRFLGAVFGISTSVITVTMIGGVVLAPLGGDVLSPRGVIAAAAAFLAVGGVLALLALGFPAPRATPEPARAPA
jgi:hypothetical protein